MLHNQSPPAFFADMAPGWALYGFVVLLLAAITGLTGLMAQRGLRIVWSATMAIGAGVAFSSLGLLWQRAAWRQRVQTWQVAHPASAPEVATMDGRVTHAAAYIALAGVAIFSVGLLASLRMGPVRHR